MTWFAKLKSTFWRYFRLRYALFPRISCTWHKQWLSQQARGRTVSQLEMVKSLASSLTNQITFPLLFKIAQSVTGHSDHLVIGKSKAVQKQKLLLGENRCCQFTNGMLVSLRWESRFCLINQSVYNCSRRVQQCIWLVPIKLVLSYEGLHPGKKKQSGAQCVSVCV